VAAGNDCRKSRVRQLLIDRKDDLFVIERIKENVSGPAPSFDREQFWLVHLGCLLTSQQRSTSGSPVDLLLGKKPFSLTLATCRGHVAEAIQKPCKISVG